MTEHHLTLTPRKVGLLEQHVTNLDIRSERDVVSVAVGDTVVYNASLRTQVVARREYENFDEMLRHEDATLILPGITRQESLRKALAFLRAVLDNEEDDIVVLELKLLSN